MSSIVIVSFSGSAFSPMLAVLPFTLTRPCLIMSSHLRLAAMPDCARIF